MKHPRYIDIIIGLGVCSMYRVNLGRLQLQKFIYLVDALSLLWDLLPSKDGYATYKHGPYDSSIQNAVDVLSFRGFVSVVESDIKKNSTIIAQYRISEIGKRLFENIIKTEPFKRRNEIFEVVSEHVNDRGWEHLLHLVYSEPTFLSKKSMGWGQPLKTGSFLTNLTLELAWNLNNISTDKVNGMTKENITTIYFQILDSFISSKEPEREINESTETTT
jgi:uncharacterized protein YwgA